jgi:hypothetical protein
MSIEEAEKIVQEYGGFIADIKLGDIVQDLFKLPYSPARIRYAILMYTETLVNNGLLSKDTENSLQMLYSALDSRFVEQDADKINSAYTHYKTNEKARKYLDSKGGLQSFVGNVEKMNEYYNFIADLVGNWSRKK